LRGIGRGLGALVKSGRERRAKMKAAAERDAMNRDLVRRLKEANAPTPQEAFLEMQKRMMGGETLAERIAANQNLAEREAIGRGVTLSD
jgi:hypothetical protein